MYQTNEKQNNRKINPWIDIWFNTRKVIRESITKDTFLFALVIGAVVGINTLWNELSTSSVEGVTNFFEHVSFTEKIVWSLLAGPVIGVISLFIMAGVFTLVGKWIGGRGTYRSLFIALGIALIPSVILLGFNVINILLIGEGLMTNASLNNVQSTWFMLQGLLTISIAVWSFLISLQSIGEAHEFSAWKALATMAIVIGLLLVFVVLIVLTVVIFLGSLF